jgi:hypothetical protein
MAKADTKPDALRRLGGGRWETKDGRFQIEPQSGTWVIVDTTQTNEFGLPLVRGPFPSLGAAKDAIESARTEGPAESPLAGRIEKVKASPPPARETKPSKTAAAKPAAKPSKPAQEEPEPPPEPAWLRNLQAGDRRRAREIIRRLEALEVATAEHVARAEIVDDEPALARLAIERRLGDAAGSGDAGRRAVRAAIKAILAGEDEDLGASWRLVDGNGRRIAGLELDT